ncbi:hypothetical protein MMC11_001005 [Xylographa trunciseda]|nr:hypothetical protein [Xylographa trunciseda]
MAALDTNRKRDKLKAITKSIFRSKSSDGREAIAVSDSDSAPKLAVPSRPQIDFFTQRIVQTKDDQSDTGETNKRSGNSCLEKALESLSEVDRAMVLNCNADSKLDLLKELHTIVEVRREDCLSKGLKLDFGGRRILLRDVTEKIIIWIQKFKEIGDIAINFDPVHAALPWAGVRFLLQIAIGESQQMGGLLIGAEKVASLINRCSVYELLYLNGEVSTKTEKNLERALVALHVTILRFLAVANRLYESSAKRALYGFLKPDEILEFVNKCRLLESELDIEVSNCERIQSQTAYLHLDEKANLLKQLIEGLREPILRIDYQVAALHGDLNQSERLKILNYLSDIPYEANHNAACEGRTKGTGGWLLRHKQFTRWRTSSSSNILWLYGIPGAGKTKLISSVVDQLLENLDSRQEGEALAYFYCKHNETDRQDPKLVLSSFVRQLAIVQDGHALHRSVVELHGKKESTGFISGSLTIEESRAALIKLCEGLAQVTLVLDALDECNESNRGQLMDTFDTLVQQSPNPVRIIISSRPDQDIEHRFKRRSNLAILASDNGDDIATFVKDRIDNSPPYWREKVSLAVKAEICNTLLVKSEGMFQWAALQTDQLLKLLPRERDIRQRLGRLPKTLDKAYDEIYTRIQAQEGSAPEIANRAFQWVMCSGKPLSYDELVAAVCYDPETDGTNSVDIDIDIVLAACHNLLTIEQKLRVCRFSHLSVQEYLESHHWSDIEANGHVAKVCLCLLNDPDLDLRGVVAKKPSSIVKIITYAVENWALHLRRQGEGQVDDRCTNLLKTFLGSMNESGPAYRRWYDAASIWSKTLGSAEWRSSLKQLRPCSNASFAICLFGFYKAVSDWWIQAPNEVCYENLKMRNNRGESLMQLASAGNNLPAVQELLRMGMGVNIYIDTAFKASFRANYFSPLQAASAKGYAEVVQILLENGAKVNALADRESLDPKGGHSWIKYSTAIQAASANGHLKIVRLLLKNGANANLKFESWKEDAKRCLQGTKYSTALQTAVAEGHQKIACLLLENGANPNIPFGLTEEEVEDLDKNRSASYLGDALTALEQAISNEDVEMVQLLLDYGAEICPFDEHGYDSAFVWACKSGNADLVHLVLRKLSQKSNYALRDEEVAANAVGPSTQNEAIVTVSRELHNKTLAGAADLGSTGTTEPLSSKGVMVNPQSKHYALALAAAANIGKRELMDSRKITERLKIMKLLLEKGADPNLQYVKGQSLNNTALQVASSRGCLEMVRFLLDNGVDVNVVGGVDSNTALQAISSFKWGRSERTVAKLLLRNRADVNTKRASADTEFQALSRKVTDKDLVQLLLKGGADVNVKENPRDRALQLASYCQSVEIVQLLLKHGADDDAREEGQGFGTALQASCDQWSSNKKIDKALVQLLLDYGADVNAEGNKFGMSLHNASSFKSTEAVKLLLEHGADANAQGGKYGAALQAASMTSWLGGKKDEALIQLLNHGTTGPSTFFRLQQSDGSLEFSKDDEQQSESEEDI